MPSFDSDIKPLFYCDVGGLPLDTYQQQMLQVFKDGADVGFDLFDYQSVKDRAAVILLEVAAGKMPRGFPGWEVHKIRTFALWVDAGCPENWN